MKTLACRCLSDYLLECALPGRWRSVVATDSNSIFWTCICHWVQFEMSTASAMGRYFCDSFTASVWEGRGLEGSRAMQPNWPCRLQTCKSQLADCGQLCRWMSAYTILTCAEYQLHAQSIAATIIRQMRSCWSLPVPLIDANSSCSGHALTRLSDEDWTENHRWPPYEMHKRSARKVLCHSKTKPDSQPDI